MRNYFGFALGIIAGCLGLLFAQQLMKPGDGVEPTAGENPESSLAAKRDAQLLADARDRIAELEEQVAAARKVAATFRVDRSDTPEFGEMKNDDGKDAEALSFVETLMSFGDKETQRKIDKEVERLAGLLGLSDNQQEIVRKALAQKATDQKAAGIKVMTGKATVDDLINSDEHNFSAVDALVQGVLDDDQLAAYAEIQEEREIKRVQTKTDGELKELENVGDLSDEQRDAAWEVLMEVNAGEKPGQLPAGMTGDDFMGVVDDAISNRVDGLRPILNDEQIGSYQEQAQDFRNIVGTLIGHATSGTEE